MQVIVAEAAKVIQAVGRNWKVNTHTGEGDNVSRMASLTEGPGPWKSPSKSWKVKQFLKILKFFILCKNLVFHQITDHQY